MTLRCHLEIPIELFDYAQYVQPVIKKHSLGCCALAPYILVPFHAQISIDQKSSGTSAGAAGKKVFDVMYVCTLCTP